MADTKRDIIGRIQTILREMEASCAFAACGRSMSSGPPDATFVTLTTANAAAITTAIGAYNAAAP
jgi:hypothetical protein